jgi:cell division protein FtsI (penicillin-binding protein 3)
MKVTEKKWIRVRIYLVVFFFLLGMGITLARAYQLQVLEQERLNSIAQSAYRGVFKLPPKRGTIYDREGHELVVSVEVESIYAHPKLIENSASAAKQLAKILDAPYKNILNLLSNDRSFVWLERKVAPEKSARVKELKLEGVGFLKESRRFYPSREIAAHLLGFSGEDNEGLEGLEKSYDDALKGPEIKLNLMRDALGRPFYLGEEVSRENKMLNLVLTIDKDIQYKAEQSLNEAVRKAGAKGGQCVVLDPETGEILAMAVAPLYNPNAFKDYEPQQWRNRTITDCFEPGSTLKAFLLGAALEEHLITPQTRFYCEEGQFQFADHFVHEAHAGGGFGTLTAAEILMYSSNIGAVKIGNKIGYGKFVEYLQKFGFGQETGIDLIGERSGYVRPENQARGADKATIFFGQGMSVSTLQLAMAMGAIANGGKLMKPYVVKALKNQKGEVVKENTPQMVRRVLSTEVALKLVKMLKGVVTEKGTAPLAAIEGYAVAGKTGTSQKINPKTLQYSKDAYVAVFAGFVPVDRPKLMIVVAIDEPQGDIYGGKVAGPIFSEIGAWSLAYLRVNPEVKTASLSKKDKKDPVTILSLNASQEEITPVLPGILPDFKGLNIREVLREARILGLAVEPQGTGMAVRQEPRAGSPLKTGEKIQVFFKPPA